MFPERPSTYKGMQLVYLPSIQTKSLSTFTHTFVSALHLAFRRADVALFVNVANSPFCLITKLAGIKTALNVDGQEWLRPKWGRTGKRYFLMSAKICGATTHRVITDAPEMQRIYRDEFNIDSVDIAYGADFVEKRDPGKIAELGLESGEYYLTCCRLVPDNNVDLLIDGFKQSGSERTYAVVGDTPYKSAYVEKLKTQGGANVRFLGQINDQDLVDELYANAYVYLHGHQYGGTNPTLLRAMAARNCVIALHTPFNTGVLEGSGLFFEKRPEALAEQIRAVDDDPEKAEARGQQSLERVRQAFTWDHITDQYEALCFELSGRQRDA
jgi:glycosyltransferase involved in cell wall biosynthesis